MQYSNFIWRDGQPFSETFDDIYYSSSADGCISGESEFNHVFFKNNGLPERWHEDRDFIIAELGFGSGLNCLLTIREWLSQQAACGQDKRLHYIAIEKYPLSPDAIIALLSQYPALQEYCDELVENYPPAVEGFHSRFLFNDRVVIHYRFMDAYAALEDESLNVDAWYLDGFSPAKNPAMWSAELFKKIAQNSGSGSTCSTYTAAGFVKRNLQNNGFTVSKVPGHGSKREMLTASFHGDITPPLKYADKPWYQSPVKYNSKNKRASIIGAGIAGLCVAHALVKRGWTVSVIDRHGDMAKETSSNPAAVVYPRLSVNNDVDTELYTAAYCYSLYMLKVLQAKHSEPFWFDHGLLQLINKDRFLEILGKFQFNRAFVAIAEDLPEGLAVDAATPGKSRIGSDSDGNVYIEYAAAGVVLPAGLCAAIKAECGDRLTIVKAEVDAIVRVAGGWQCNSGRTKIDSGEIVVIANGTEIKSLDMGLGLYYPVENIRGQVAVLKEKAQSNRITKTVNAGKYITPALQGKHYLGATYSSDNTSPGIVLDDTYKLLTELDTVYPDLFGIDDCSGSWAGIRSMSKDRCPIAGAVPDVDFFNHAYADIRHGNTIKEYQPARYTEGLYITAAHGSRGFTSSFLTAEIIAAQISGEPVPVSKRVVDFISASRFIVNDLKRR